MENSRSLTGGIFSKTIGVTAMADTLQEIINRLEKVRQETTLSPAYLKQFLEMVLGSIAKSKAEFETLSAQNIETIQFAIKYIEDQNQNLLKEFGADNKQATKDFESKLALAKAFLKEVKAIKVTPGKPGKDGKDGKPGKDGKDGIGIDGKDGSPDTAEQVRDKLETLKDDNRLDASAIKGLEKFFGTIKRGGKQMLVGGIRFLENLADVSINITNKRQDMLLQYNTTNHRWQDGSALTVGTTAPSNPKINDVWIDTN